MPKTGDLVLRILLLIGAFYNFLGYLWAGGKSQPAPYEIYAAAPWIALVVGAFIPNRMLAKASGKIIFLPPALLAIVRNCDQLIVDLALVNGPDLLAAGFRALAILLLVVVAVKSYALSKTSEFRSGGAGL